jgi:two-component system chemotaxis sensor kinase CheA
MSYEVEKINENLETLALEVVTLGEKDLSGLGKILNTICDLEINSGGMDESDFPVLIQGIKGYLEQLIMGEMEDISPLEEAIRCLQSFHQALSRHEEFKQDVSPLLGKLGFTETRDEIDDFQTGGMAEKSAPATENKETDSFQEFTEEDREILIEFAAESLENLAAIEVGLIHLEENPDDLEIINDIFRPFHTIKGVSGFLRLDKINKLSHSLENLLDQARNGQIKIEETIVDIILESVDTLTKMVLGVREGLENDTSPDIGLDIAPLIERIEDHNYRSAKVADKPLGEIMIEKGVLSQDLMSDILDEQKRDPEKKFGEILVEKGAAGSKEVISALREQKKFGRKAIDLHIKVDTKKLDTLVEMTGELVIAHSMLKGNASILSTTDQKLSQLLNQINLITSTLQKTTMSMRMVPIKSTFQKMVRLVRELAKSSGKEVGLKMIGEDTEIDRNMVDELYEPMVHMIRNSVDHGIEPLDERENAGKDRRGTIQLRAYHRGGNIVIEIEDDGKGLDKNRIIENARKNNIINADSNLTESDIYNLIFQPGLSTAKEVTDISGRGVGMDVVKRAIEKLRGRVEITSRPGQGSMFIIRLPLTLAIMEGMLVRVGQERYIIPALMILESFLPDKKQYFTVEGKGEVVVSRDDLIPLIRLDRLFGFQGDAINPWDGLVVAVEHDGEKRSLLIDELLGKEEVVIKSLGESLKDTKGIAGGAIMGDGRVGLILDIPGIIEIAEGK